MPRRRSVKPPNESLASGEWPDGPLKSNAPDEARAAQQLARNVRAAMTTQGLSQHKVAEKMDMDQGTISRLLAGTIYIDTATLAKLEAVLKEELWPHRAPKPPAQGKTE
ncbi:helix-turn-helix domain-containing protein [Amycolatopsis antarctica]|uniref:helix-turn-helix domain-containing protein n=1 Tax=Amycolatopsis antarctica TaxID=1854586 RepID=UPI0013FD8702|nr:helix-turn-helix transcriptional regulator [Amycolatopsis antarctica]